MWPFRSKNMTVMTSRGTWGQEQSEETKKAGDKWDFKTRIMSPLDSTDPNESFKFPNKNQSLAEIAEKHRAGVFEYVTITTETTWSKKELNNVLMARMKGAATLSYDLTDFPVVDLRNTSMGLNLGRAVYASVANKYALQNKRLARSLPSKELVLRAKDSMLKYTTFNCILYHFDPTDGYSGEMSFVKVSIMDNRTTIPRCIRSMIHNSNLSFSAMFALDHSIFRDDLQEIEFVVENPRNKFKPNIVWGSVTMDMVIVESDRSVTTDLLPVTGTHRVGYSFLQSHRRNPKHLDASIKQTGREELRRLMRGGMIMNRTKSANNQNLDLSKMMGSAADSLDLEDRDRFEEEQDNDYEAEQMSEASLRRDEDRRRSSDPQNKGKGRADPNIEKFLTASQNADKPPMDPIPLSPRNPFKAQIEAEQAAAEPPKPLKSSFKAGPSSSFQNVAFNVPSGFSSTSFAAFTGTADRPLPSERTIPISPSSKIEEIVDYNREIVAEEELGSKEKPIQVLVDKDHPHVIATTEALPANSILFSSDNRSSVF